MLKKLSAVVAVGLVLACSACSASNSQRVDMLAVEEAAAQAAEVKDGVKPAVDCAGDSVEVGSDKTLHCDITYPGDASPRLGEVSLGSASEAGYEVTVQSLPTYLPAAQEQSSLTVEQAAQLVRQQLSWQQAAESQEVQCFGELPLVPASSVGCSVEFANDQQSRAVSLSVGAAARVSDVTVKLSPDSKERPLREKSADFAAVLAGSLEDQLGLLPQVTCAGDFIDLSADQQVSCTLLDPKTGKDRAVTATLQEVAGFSYRVQVSVAG